MNEKTRKKDWGKLVGHMKHLKATAQDVLTSSVDKGINNMEWSIDLAFSVHPQTLRVMLEAQQASREALAKQKLDTTNLTMAELA